MNVLILDDIDTNRKLLRAQLEAEGVTVLEASDGVEGLEELKRQKVDAAISDPGHSRNILTAANWTGTGSRAARNSDSGPTASIGPANR